MIHCNECEKDILIECDITVRIPQIPGLMCEECYSKFLRKLKESLQEQKKSSFVLEDVKMDWKERG